MIKKIASLAVILSAGVLFATSQLEAATVTCNVSNIGYTPNGSGTLQLQCGGVWYYGFGSSSTCPVATADTRKAWQGLAQSAFLSGKRLTIDATTCTGGPGITYVQLLN